jgi:putative hemolysin
MTKLFSILFFASTASTVIAAGTDTAKSAKVCADFGGTSSVVKSETGSDVRLCSFGRGIIGEETFFKAKQSKAVAIFLNPPPAPPIPPPAAAPTGDPKKIPSAPNPSSRKCQQAGGHTVIVREPAGDFSVCEFSDHSLIEEWTLFRGRSDDLNKSLAAALEKRVKSR